jgi:hypothetical protein
VDVFGGLALSVNQGNAAKVTWHISVRVFLRAAGWYVNGYFAKQSAPRKISGLLRERGYGVDACW